MGSNEQSVSGQREGGIERHGRSAAWRATGDQWGEIRGGVWCRFPCDEVKLEVVAHAQSGGVRFAGAMEVYELGGGITKRQMRLVSTEASCDRLCDAQQAADAMWEALARPLRKAGAEAVSAFYESHSERAVMENCREELERVVEKMKLCEEKETLVGSNTIGVWRVTLESLHRQLGIHPRSMTDGCGIPIGEEPLLPEAPLGVKGEADAS